MSLQVYESTCSSLFIYAMPSRFHSTPSTAEKHATIDEELGTLPDLIKAKFKGWDDGPHDFQSDCMGAQAHGIDVLLHAATSSGKTGIVAGPHLLPSSKGKVTLFVSPLIALHAEQVCSLCIVLILSSFSSRK